MKCKLMFSAWCISIQMSCNDIIRWKPVSAIRHAIGELDEDVRNGPAYVTLSLGRTCALWASSSSDQVTDLRCS